MQDFVSLSRLLLFFFLPILSFWTDPSTIYFLLLRALPPMQDFVSLPIIIIFILISFVFLDGPGTISFLLLLALPPIQDFGSPEILFLFFILVIDISVLSFDISALLVRKYKKWK
jgi:hypothetical protein